MGTRHTEAAELSVLPRLTDERAYLYGIIRTIGAGPDLRSILAGVVRLATEATQCHACLIWFLEGDRLVLRASSEPYAALAGSISVAMGEGLVGWVARTKRSAFIEEGALDDPRVKYFPELEEEHFQSLVSVPVFGRGGDVMGVVSLHAEAPHEFAREDLDFLEHTAALTAGAVENARLYEESTARVDLLTELSRLSRCIAAAGTSEELLAAVVSGTRDLLRATRCEIYLMDFDGSLVPAVADPAWSRDSRTGGHRTMAPGLDAGRLGDAADLANTLWGTGWTGTPLFESLTVGDDVLGLVAVLTPSATPGALTALSAIAAHTAVALRQHELVDRLLEKNLVTEFFEALARRDAPPGRETSLAMRLGIDLERPHAVVVVTPWLEPDVEGRTNGTIPGWNDLAVEIESRLSARIPGVSIDRTDRTIRVLMPWASPSSGPADELREALGMNEGPALSVGISNPCVGADPYPEAFDEATAAAEIGALLRGGPGVAEFRDLGAFRYVLTSPDLARDVDRQRLDRLLAYDRRRGTTLLDTLERFLDERGNVVGTARTLYIHPNTLRQRLERIETETGLDLDRDDWLSLAIAVKAVKLEYLRGRSSRQD